MTKFLNNLLCTTMSFLLTFAWVVCCFKNVKIAVAAACTVAVCCCYILFILLSKIETRENRKVRAKKQLRDFAQYLQFNCDNSALFMQMFSYYNFITEIVDFDNIIIAKDKRIFATFCFGEQQLSLEEMRRAVVCAKRHNCQGLMIFCNCANGNLLAVANSQLPTTLVDLPNTFTLFEQAGALPQIPSQKVQKQHLVADIAFNKKRFGWYFFGAFFTLATSLFSYVKIYLLAWATVLFGLSLYCLCNKRHNKVCSQITPDSLANL